MKNILTLVTLTIGITLLSCQNKNTSSSIVCTTTIVSDIVNNIKPPSLTIMGPGIDPHLYKSKSGDHVLMNDAPVIVYSGLHLEGKMTEALEALSKKKTVIAVTNGIDKKHLVKSDEFGGSFDPHFWFDVDLYKQAVLHCSKELKQHYKKDKPLINMNTEKYIHGIDSIALQLEKTIQTLPIEKRILVTAHDAFSYFGIKYQFTVKGIQGASTVAEAGLKDITNLVDYIIANDVQAIFVESSVSERNINAIIEGCQHKGHTLNLGGTLYSDALGDKNGPAGTYLSMMTHNINTIVKALKN